MNAYLLLGQGTITTGKLGSVLVMALGLMVLPLSLLRAQDDSMGNGAPPPPDQSDQSQGAPPPDVNGDQGNMAPAPNSGDQQPNTTDDSAGGTSFQTFYDSLQNQGQWIQSNDYGYVWQPQVTDPDWAPYTEGHWVYTDDGWTWVSDEPWGWATYHYGRWANIDGTGWCWVPGYTWAPAWVSWRYGGGYCGWAALPPDSFAGIDYYGGGFAVGFGFHIGGDCDSFFGIGAGCYNFLPVGYLGYRSYNHYYVPRYNNYGVINRTTNVTNINVTRNRTNNSGGGTAFANSRRVTTGGPSFSQVNAVSQTPVQRVSLQRQSVQPGGGGTLSGNTLSLYAPHVRTSGSAMQPGRVTGSLGNATINRGTDITRPLAVNNRLTPPPATESQVQAARVAQERAPASAKIVTATADVRPVLNAPLSSLRPVTTYASRSEVGGSSPRGYSGQAANGQAYNNIQRVNPNGTTSTATRQYPVVNPNVDNSGRAYTPSTAAPYSPRTYSPDSGSTYSQRSYAPTESAPRSYQTVPGYSPGTSTGGRAANPYSGSAGGRSYLPAQPGGGSNEAGGASRGGGTSAPAASQGASSAPAAANSGGGASHGSGGGSSSGATGGGGGAGGHGGGGGQGHR